MQTELEVVDWAPKYHKINTAFKRSPADKFKTLLPGQWSEEAFEYLRNCPWEWTEKVDGTNIRAMWDGTLSFRGKTDKAQMSPALMKGLEDAFGGADMADAFGEGPVCLYGEGYGGNIQKAGPGYREDISFVLFDVLIGGYWLQREDVEGLGTKLGLRVAPLVGIGTLHEMVEYVKAKPQSTWGMFTMEGVVARPQVALLSRNRTRIITKLKARDFQ